MLTFQTIFVFAPLRRSLVLGLAIGLCLQPVLARADDPKQDKPASQASGSQSGQKPKKERHRNTPLDTILQTRIWADTPEPKDFIKEHRPDKDKLTYQPVTGTDPERPVPRTPAQLKDLESELEDARVKADKRAGIKPAPSVSSAPKP